MASKDIGTFAPVLDLDRQTVHRLETIAEDSAMTINRLITDIVKGFLYQSGHDDDKLETNPESCAEVDTLFDYCDSLSNEVGEIKADLGKLRQAFAAWLGISGEVTK